MGQLLKNQKGSIAPGVVLIILMMMVVGSLFFSLSAIYGKRTVVRDALDAAVTSALAAGAHETFKDTYYYEALVCVAGHYETSTDSDGHSHSYFVCDKWEWRPFSSAPANYIYLNPSEAESVALEFFKKNLDLNMKGTYKIKRFKLTYEYDQRRFIVVTSERYNTAASPSWWYSEFGDTTPPPMTAVSTSKVRAPRWAKVTIEAEVEVYTPLGRFFGDGTMDFTWKATAVKEVKGVSQ